MAQQQELPTIAILSGNPLVNCIIKSLLEGYGYKVRLLEEVSKASQEEIFEDVNLVLLVPTVSEGVQRAFRTKSLYVVG